VSHELNSPAVLRRDIDGLTETVERLEGLLDGNGDGHLAKLRRAEERIEGLLRLHDDKGSDKAMYVEQARWKTIGHVMVALTALCGLGMSIFTYYSQLSGG